MFGSAPLSYYGMAAQRFLKSIGAPVTSLESEIRSDASDPFPDMDWAPHMKAPYSRDLRRGFELLHLGLPDEAASEFERAEAAVSDKRLLAELAKIYNQNGFYSRSVALANGNLKSYLLSKGVPDQYNDWRLAYPRAYGRVLTDAATKFNVPELLLLSVMREESTFRPDVVSVSGAVGLLQIMPKTAKRLASMTGMETVSVESLKDPSINITLGAAYLRFLLDRYNNDAWRAIAAYNAGEPDVDLWISRRPADEGPEFFVEEIPFEQTRDYVRKVTRTLEIYRLLYER